MIEGSNAYKDALFKKAFPDRDVIPQDIGGRLVSGNDGHCCLGVCPTRMTPRHVPQVPPERRVNHVLFYSNAYQRAKLQASDQRLLNARIDNEALPAQVGGNQLRAQSHGVSLDHLHELLSRPRVAKVVAALAAQRAIKAKGRALELILKRKEEVSPHG